MLLFVLSFVVLGFGIERLDSVEIGSFYRGQFSY